MQEANNENKALNTDNTAEQRAWHTSSWHVARARLVWHIMHYCAVDIFEMLRNKK
jgi:hypothetical protein